MQITAQAIIDRLRLEPHPEGGWYRETWRGPAAVEGGRSAGTAIHFLLERGQVSAWHRVDASELWLHQGGGPLRLLTAEADGCVVERRLGAGVLEGDLLQALVAPGEWQSASTEADWSLVACVVAPGFEFSGFELAPSGWKPGVQPPVDRS